MSKETKNTTFDLIWRIGLGVLLTVTILLYIIIGPNPLVTKILLFASLAAIILTFVFYRQLFTGFIKRSGTVTGIYKSVQLFIILLILVFIYIFSDSLNLKFDFSGSKLYQLSEQTISVLKNVTNEMNVVVFKVDVGEPTIAMKLDYIQKLLESYASKNPNIKIEILDPRLNPVKMVKYNVNINNPAKIGTVVFEYMGNKVEVQSSLITTHDPQSGDVVFHGEVEFTSAIKNLLAQKPRVVYVLTGHGEFDLLSEGGGYSWVLEELRRESINVMPVDLQRVVDIPADAGCLLILNPIKMILPDELDKIMIYLNNGGSVFMMLEYETDYMVNDILRQMGLYMVKNNLIIEQENYQTLGNIQFLPSIIGGHEITLPFKDYKYNVKLMTASAIEQLPADKRPLGYGYLVYPLMRTSEYAYAETSEKEIAAQKVEFNTGVDIQGPMYPAWAVTRSKTEYFTNTMTNILLVVTNVTQARMVVIGDADFASDVYINSAPGNMDFFMNSLMFLMKRDTDIVVRPKTSDVMSTYSLTGLAQRILTAVAIVVVAVYIGIGIFILIRRSRKVKTKEKEKE
ncbi:MAG: hypothetical protein A2Y33_16735 [Spirochaetes bacterium GWF1_51_8]|nr:MAG: hypothetical protein A2Y33_16735 [Spirochaetes bacterium GWF1_51_8]